MDYRHTIQAEINFAPGKEYSVCHRLWQGCPTIARSRGGRLYAGWYSGGMQEPSLFNYNLLVRSDDNGLTWSEPLLVINSMPEKLLQALDIQLWCDNDGRLWVFYVQRIYNFLPQWLPEHLNTWAIICENPDAEQLEWSEPRYIGNGFLRCQPTTLSDGRILLPAYDWCCDRYKYFSTSDKGETFQCCYAGKKVKTPFDEGMFLERNDHSLLLFARTSTGFIAKSESFDGGCTWTDGTNTNIPNPSTRFCLLRLKSGRVLLINNMDSKCRTAMNALLSEDDGRTFPYSLLLDTGEPVSYPDAVQGDDGEIYIIWDRGRTTTREIVCARITEDDIFSGKVLDDRSYCWNIVSKAMIAPEQWEREPLKSFAASEREFLQHFHKEVYREGGIPEKLRPAVNDPRGL